jgi:NADH-quinone oxidoreductase subunit D
MAVSNTPVMELTVDDLKEIRGLVSQRALDGETVLLNMGPQHPSTHGVLRLLLEIDGENVVSCVPDVGFLHTGIEKTAEDKTYVKVIPLTDRMDYLSPMTNNLGYVMAVEKLMDVEVPLRAQYVRVILCELQRLSSHLVWLGTHAMDLAAMSVFLYCFREREKILDIFEMVSGQRMMVSYFRPGGLWRDLPTGFEEAVRAFMDHFPREIDEYEGLLKKNPLWIDRTRGVGVISARDAVAWGVTGPSLRGSGVNWDIRKAIPYSAYDHFEFDVPLREEGDVYARFWCRVMEMRQSLRIIDQALKKLPTGPFITPNRKVAPPPKEELAYSMESLIHHFKLWTEGFMPPKGEVYVRVESPRGEFGCYLCSDGSARPRRVHFRTPSFANLSAMPQMTKGAFIADLVAIIGSIDIVLGDVDR